MPRKASATTPNPTLRGSKPALRLDETGGEFTVVSPLNELLGTFGHWEEADIVFVDDEGRYAKPLYALGPVSVDQSMVFVVAAQEIPLAGMAELFSIRLHEDSISIEAWLYESKILEKSVIHPRLLLQALGKEPPPSFVFTVNAVDMEDHDDRHVGFAFTTAFVAPIRTHIEEFENRIHEWITEVSRRLSGGSWSEIWNNDERAFSAQLLAPLLRALGYDQVSNNHGRGEFGKDLLCRDMDRFGIERWVGVQVKAGDITGEVNSMVDTIVGQIIDAFAIPFDDVASRSPKYISMLYVICSGRISENARVKILKKIPDGLVGAVTFIDRQHLLGLIERYLPAKS